MLRHAYSQRTLSCSSYVVSSLYDNYHKDIDYKPGSRLLRSLKNIHIHTLSETLSAIQLQYPIPIRGAIGTDILFSRSINSQLFDSVRSESRAVLIGNAGTSKSMFQYYYLYRLVNHKALPLGKDSYGSLQPPKVVIRQEGEKSFTVYFIQEEKAHFIPNGDGGILHCFDPETSLFLFEPGSVKKEPHLEGLTIPTFATVSPDTSRYKEFIKNGGISYYMPIWSLEDLMEAGKFLKTSQRVPADLVALYSEQSIRERYDEFGGIFRHVLPVNRQALDQVLARKKQAIIDAVGKDILSTGDIENDKISHFILHFDVETIGDHAFRSITSRIASESTLKRVRSKIREVDLKTRIETLMRNDETGYLNDFCPTIFEGVVSDLLVRSQALKFESKSYIVRNKSKSDEDIKSNWNPVSISFKWLNTGEIPKFREMEEGVLYRSLNTEFPSVDLVFKKGDILYGIQLTRNKSCIRTIEKAALEDLFRRLDISDASLFRYILCPTPKLAGNYQINFPDNINASAIEIWRLPNDYGLSQIH